MNDPNKAIDVNLSSLLSLKAELLRKQTEVNKMKAKKTSFEEYSAHKSQRAEVAHEESSYTKNDKLLKKMERLQKLDKNDNSAQWEHEDTALLEKSKRILIAKAKFYDRMSKSGGKLNSDDNCLVMFNKKRQEDTPSILHNKVPDKEEETTESSDNDCEEDISDNESVASDEEWVEYIDCLGRTRKCLRKDLAENQKRDAELAASMPERLDQTKANWMIDTLNKNNKTSVDGNCAGISSSIFGDGCSIMSKHEEQKHNWERKEQENLEKTHVHYQDVFFDEARQHGVGYYAFSTDEEERRRQQRELEKARQETTAEQEKREALRKQRENVIAERVWAAKNRQRARLGLPPLEKDDILQQSKQEVEKETKKERKVRRKAEKLAKKREEEEKQREFERQQHIRPWDYNKNGLPCKTVNKPVLNEDENPENWMYKPEYEPMTQEQWNEYKRSERTEEFAPPVAAPPPPTGRPIRTHFVSRTISSEKEDINVSSETHVQDDTFVNYQSTKESIKTLKRNHNDLTHTKDNEEDFFIRRGAAIPPPTCLDNEYFQVKKPKSSQELEHSIEAGLRFLRNKYDKQSYASKNTWTANADY